MIYYAIKLRMSGVPLLGGKIEHLHNLPAGQTKYYQFKIQRPGFISLEISKDIENVKEKKEETGKADTREILS